MSPAGDDVRADFCRIDPVKAIKYQIIVIYAVVDSQPVYHHCLLANLPGSSIIRVIGYGSDAAQKS